MANKIFSKQDFEKTPPQEDVETPFVEKSSLKEKETPIVEESSQKKSNKWFILGGAVAIAIALGVFFFSNGGEDNAVEPVAPVVIDNQTQTETIDNQPEAEVAESQAVEQEGDATPSTESVEESVTDAEAPTAEVNQPTESIKEQSSKPTQSSNVNAYGSNVQQPVAVSDDVNENALKAIRGDFGNGQVRKDKLGASYEAIQNRVNELYRNGQVF